MSGWRERFKLEAEIQARRLKCKPTGSDSSPQAQIQAWWLRSKPTGSIEAWRLWSAYVSLRDQAVLGPLGIWFQTINGWFVWGIIRGLTLNSTFSLPDWWICYVKPLFPIEMYNFMIGLASAPPRIPSQDFQNIGFIGFICFLNVLFVFVEESIGFAE